MRQRHEDVIDVVRSHDLFRLLDRAETWQIRKMPRFTIPEIANDAEPELVAMQAHTLEDYPLQLAVSRDQYPVEIFPGAMPLLHRRPNDDPADDRDQHRAHHENRQRGPRVQRLLRIAGT